MGRLHVPFDELTGSSTCEHALRDAVAGGERIALIGPSGCGKSSVTQHFLDHPLAGLAPLRVRVGLEPVEVAEDPVRFAGHLVHVVVQHLAERTDRSSSRAAERAEKAIDPQRTRRPISIGAGGGAVWAQGSLRLELGGVVGQRVVSGSNVVEQAQQVLDVIRAHDLAPLLVLDDTDHWVQAPAPDEYERRLTGFFGRVLRLIAEQLDAAVILAVHDRYLTEPAYQAAQEFLGTRIEVPRVPDSAALARILDRRLADVSDPQPAITLTDVLEESALQSIHAHYRQRGPNLRHPLVIAHEALSIAVDAGASAIAKAHVDVAASDWTACSGT